MSDPKWMFSVSKEELEDAKNDNSFQHALGLVDEIYEEYDEFIANAKAETNPPESVKELKRARLTCCIVEIAERIASDIVEQRIKSLSDETHK